MSTEFYQLKELHSIDEGYVATIELNANHAIYRGHFPSRPVVPAVVQMMIIQELTERFLGHRLLPLSIEDALIDRMIEPGRNTQISIHACIRQSDDQFRLKAELIVDKDSALQLSLVLARIGD